MLTIFFYFSATNNSKENYQNSYSLKYY